MENTSQAVKRADRRGSSIGSKVHIDSSGGQRLMSHKSLYGKQVNPILIKGSAKSVTERMTGQLMLQAEFAFFGRDKLADGIRNDMLVGMVPFGEEPAGPVFQKRTSSP